jgi:hypothetical protein
MKSGTPSPRLWGEGQGEGFGLPVVVGLVAIAVWIGIDPFYPKLIKATSFDASGDVRFRRDKKPPCDWELADKL